MPDSSQSPVGDSQARFIEKRSPNCEKKSLNAVLMDPNDQKTELSQNFGTDAGEKIDNFLTYEYKGRGASDHCGGPFAVF